MSMSAARRHRRSARRHRLRIQCAAFAWEWQFDRRRARKVERAIRMRLNPPSMSGDPAELEQFPQIGGGR